MTCSRPASILYGTTVIVPLFFETMRGYPAMQAGIATVPRGIGSLLAIVVVGTLLAKFDGRPLIAPGLLIGGWSTWAMGYANLGVGSGDLWWPQFWQGVSMGPHLRAPHHAHLRHHCHGEAGKRNSLVQPAAQHRQQRRSFHGHHHPRPPHSVQHGRAWSESALCQPDGDEDGCRGAGPIPLQGIRLCQRLQDVPRLSVRN